MKCFLRTGVLSLGIAGLAVLLAGCSRNVSSTPTATVTQNPAPVTAGTTPSAISWEPSLEAALKRARTTQKPVMVDFYATWCGPCKMLDAQIYPAPDVVREAENFVSVKVDVDQQQALAQKYNITGMPTIVFLDASGQEVHRTRGVSSQVSWFVQEMQTARAKVAPTAA